MEHSFWADTPADDEGEIWGEDALRALKQIENAQIVSYGVHTKTDFSVR